VDRLVGLEQRAVRLAQDLVAQVVELSVGEPRQSSSVRLRSRTASWKTPGRIHSRKPLRRLLAESEGTNPCPWSMIVQPSGPS
jgi:hypothetical protein